MNINKSHLPSLLPTIATFDGWQIEEIRLNTEGVLMGDVRKITWVKGAFRLIRWSGNVWDVGFNAGGLSIEDDGHDPMSLDYLTRIKNDLEAELARVCVGAQLTLTDAERDAAKTNKIEAIRMMRFRCPGLGLKAAKDIVDAEMGLSTF